MRKMLTSTDEFKRMTKEGVQFFSTLRQRRQQSAQQAATA
jgi:hypothetical protein